MPDRSSELTNIPSVSIEPEVFRSTFDFFRAFGDFEAFFATLGTIWDVYSVIAFILSGIFIYGIIYSYIRINEYGEVMTKMVLDDEERWRQLHNPDQGNRRWQEVEAHVQSNNPNDWKLAIIEADVMLEKMLEEAGYAGTTIADRLRSASTRSFGTVEDAWAAHRVRNQIAHGGTDFVLTQKMAQATIIQYKKVFQEFGMV